MKAIIYIVLTLFIISCTETNEPIINKPISVEEPIYKTYKVNIIRVSEYKFITSHYPNETIKNDTVKIMTYNIKRVYDGNYSSSKQIINTDFNIQSYKRAQPTTIIYVVVLDKLSEITEYTLLY